MCYVLFVAGGVGLVLSLWVFCFWVVFRTCVVQLCSLFRLYVSCEYVVCWISVAIRAWAVVFALCWLAVCEMIGITFVGVLGLFSLFGARSCVWVLVLEVTFV